MDRAGLATGSGGGGSGGGGSGGGAPKVVSVWLDQCLPGMIVAETVMNSYKASVVNSGTVLDDRLIQKLQNLGYMRIRVYADSDREIESRTHAQVQREYRRNLDEITAVLRDVASGKTVDVVAVNEISERMLSRGNDIMGILSCINLVRDADEYTYAHSLNVAFITMMIARWIGLPEEEVPRALEAGLMHDVGKCRVPPEILNKPGKLTEDEFSIMKKHPVYGYQILLQTREMPEGTRMAAFMHHEKIDGTGYPQGLPGSRIHAYGKMVAVADVYDAMTSNRVYRKKESPFEVFSMLEDRAFGGLDPYIVHQFLANLGGYCVGDRVLLSNGASGTVVFINPQRVSRPVIETRGGPIDLNMPANAAIKVTEFY